MSGKGLKNPHAGPSAASALRRSGVVHEDRRTHIPEPRWQVIVSVGVAALILAGYVALFIFSQP